MNNYYNQTLGRNQYGYMPSGNMGLRDKIDQSSGLSVNDPNKIEFTSLEHTIFIDTRDCIGSQSFNDAKIYAEINGILPQKSGIIYNTTGAGVYPVIITTDTTEGLTPGCQVIISNIFGNENVNGVHYVINVLDPFNFTIQATSYGNYLSGGIWTKPADNGFPAITTENSVITGNIISVPLQRNLKYLKSVSLYHIVIPRDIIPITSYFKNFIQICTNLSQPDTTVLIDYTSFIPQEEKYTEQQTLGFFSTPLEIFRSYLGTSFSIPNQVTPPPLNLWNPNTLFHQPVSYPYQTVPTYVSADFFINVDLYHIVLSGYGVYDLVDWTIDTGNPVEDADKTDKIRKMLLLLICRRQSYKNVDYIELIKNCTTVSNTNISEAFGFGNFQRYVPGPGLGQNYQPGTNPTYNNGGAGSGPPNVPQPDSPINFPNFQGNVWGPYSSPGDRFQKLGYADVVQDLFLNGDLDNINGDPIIFNNVIIANIANHPTYGLNFSSFNQVNLGNIDQVNNLNILNAMRIFPNGFGAANIRATGSGITTSVTYESAGGIGPNVSGPPNSWVNNDVYGGVGSFQYPLAKGPLNPNLGPDLADSTINGTGVEPRYLASFVDTGINNGNFILGITKYINFVVNEVPDTDLILKVNEALRDERVQSTNSFNSDALLDCPIRLNLGSTSGTIQYIESLQSLVGNASTYWEKRYLNTKAEISKMNITLYTYDGKPIPIEKMLVLRQSSYFLEIYDRFIRELDINIKNTVFDDFVFDPQNPQLNGRVKRYIQIIFHCMCYNGLPPGMNPDSDVSRNMWS